MKYIIFIFQHTLQVALIFFLSFVWTRYFFDQLWISLLVSGLITLIFEVLLRFFARKKDKKNSLKIKEKEEAENMFLSLQIDQNYLDLFLKIAKKESLDSQKKKDYIVLSNFKHKTLLFPQITFTPLTAEDVAKSVRLAKKEQADKIVIVCGEISKEASSFACSVAQNIVLLDKFSTYSDIYKYYQIYPVITTSYKKSKKAAFKQLFAYSFNRSRTKGYFLSALFLLLSTLFVKLNIYYCIVSSILIVFAFLSYFNKSFNQSSTNKGLGF